MDSDQKEKTFGNIHKSNKTRTAEKKQALQDYTVEGLNQRAMLKKQALSGIAPHGGSIERVNNEERLNFTSDTNRSKINSKDLFRKREKSIDLSMQSNQFRSFQQNVVTNALIKSNKLHKQATGFIGSKDFRRSEERELDKCTFNPKSFNHHSRFKTIKARLSDYIKGEQPYHRNVEQGYPAMYPKEHRVQSLASPGKFMILDSNEKMTPKNKTDNSGSYSLSSTLKAKLKPNIYASPSSNLGVVLKFGYSHKFQEKNYYRLSSTKNGNTTSKRAKNVQSSTQTVRLSFHENKGACVKSKMKTPKKKLDKKRTLSINTAFNL